MTKQVEELTRGEALARVAVLETELAELRKRVCVPERYVAVPVDMLKDASEVIGYIDSESHNPPTVDFSASVKLRLDAEIDAALAPVERNQCDGCQAGIPVEGGMHRMGKPGGYSDMMACTAERYGSAPVERVEHDHDAIALDKARNIMQIMYGEMPKGGSTQLLAMVQECVLEAMSHVCTPQPAPTDDPWKASGVEYDRAIHHNPDAKAWADLFVQTFPAQADQHELMLGWFANAMMAMYDHLTQKENTAAQDVAGLVEFAVRSWHEQVANRPLVNVHRHTLDSVWRQVIRFAGEDDVVLIGPRHDDMLDESGNPLPQYAAYQIGGAK